MPEEILPAKGEFEVIEPSMREIKDAESYLKRVANKPSLVRAHYCSHSPLLFPGYDIDVDYNPDSKTRDAESSPLVKLKPTLVKLIGDNCGLWRDNSFAEDLQVNLLAEAKSGALGYLNLTSREIEKYNIPGATLSVGKLDEKTAFLYYRPNRYLKEGLFIYNLADAISLVALDRTFELNKFRSLEDVFGYRKKNRDEDGVKVSPRLQLLYGINNKRESSYPFEVRVLTGLSAPSIINSEFRGNTVTIGLFEDTRGYKRGRDVSLKDIIGEDRVRVKSPESQISFRWLKKTKPVIEDKKTPAKDKTKPTGIKNEKGFKISPDQIEKLGLDDYMG